MIRLVKARIEINYKDEISESELETLSDKLEELDLLQKLESAMRELLRERLGEQFYHMTAFIED